MRSLLYKTAENIPSVYSGDEIRWVSFENALNLKEIREACNFYKKKYGIHFMICGEILLPNNTKSSSDIKDQAIKEIELICRNLKSNEQIGYLYKTNGLQDAPSHVQVLILKKSEVVIPIGSQQDDFSSDYCSKDFQEISLRCFASPLSNRVFQERALPQRDGTSCAALGLFYLKKEMQSENCLKLEYYDEKGKKQGLFIGSLETLHYSQSETYIEYLEGFLMGSEESSEPTLTKMLTASIKIAEEKKDEDVKKSNQEVLSTLKSNQASWEKFFTSERDKRGEKLGEHNRTLIIRQLMLRKKLFEDFKETVLPPRRVWRERRPYNETSGKFPEVKDAIRSNSKESLLSFDPRDIMQLDQKHKKLLIQNLLFYFPENIMEKEILEKFFIPFLSQEDISNLLIAAACYYRWQLVEYLCQIKEPSSPSSFALIYALKHAAQMGNQDIFNMIVPILDAQLKPEEKDRFQLLLNTVKNRAQFDLIEEIKKRILEEKELLITLAKKIKNDVVLEKQPGLFSAESQKQSIAKSELIDSVCAAKNLDEIRIILENDAAKIGVTQTCLDECLKLINSTQASVLRAD